MSKIYLIVGFLLFIVLTIAIFFSSIWKPLFFKDNILITSSKPHSSDTYIRVVSPRPNDVIEGTVTVSGEASEYIGDLTIEVLDVNNKVLAVTHTEALPNWTKTVSITEALSTFVGRVVVYPTDEGNKSRLTQSVPVTFDVITVSDRLVIYSPLRNQIMKGASVHIAGKMKGIFEGVLHVRLLDDKNTVIYKDVIHAKGDNYDTFSEFAKDVKFGTIISTTLTNGSWQFYDVSAKDGSETVLTTISIRFK